MTAALIGVSALALASIGGMLWMGKRRSDAEDRARKATKQVAELKVELAEVRTDLADEQRARQGVEQQLQSVAREKARETDGHRRQLQILREEVAELEEELGRCNVPGATRARLGRLLEHAAERRRGPES